MFWSLFVFELHYQSRQLSWWFAVVMLAALGWFLSGRQMYHVNVLALSPQNITYGLMFLCKASLFTTALFAANAALRDHHCHFHALIQTKPVPRRVLTGSRFLSLFVISLVPIFTSVLGLLLPLLFTEYNPDIQGVFSLAHVLWPLLVVVVPNMLLISIILYACATVCKSSIMTFVAAVAIYMVYILSAAMLDSPLLVASTPLAREQINVASLVDPFALSAFLEQTNGFTAQQLNTHQVALEGNFLYNRIIWLGLSLLLLMGATYPSRYTEEQQKQNTKSRKKNAVKAVPPHNAVLPFNPLTTTSFNPVLAFVSVVRLELTMIVKSKSFALLLLLISGLVMALVINGIHNNPLVGQQLPFSSILMSYVQPPLKMVGLFMMIFFSGELVWRAREHKFADVLLVTSVPPSIRFVAMITVMACLLVLVISLLISLVIGYQLMTGFSSDDISLLLYLFPLHGLPLLLTAMLGLSVQSVVNNKYTGFFIVGSVVLFYYSDVATLLGVEHHLLRFAETGPRFFSDFNGYDFYLKRVFWLSLYWLFVTGFIATLAYGLSKRDMDEDLTDAIMRLPSLFGVKSRTTAVSFLVGSLCSASYVFYNTHIVNQYHTTDDQLAFQINYESQLQTYKHLPSPKITAMDLDVAFYPSKYAVDITGNYHLTNPHNEAISQFLVTLRGQELQLALSRAYRSKHNKAQSTVEVFLEEALLPGQQLQLSFTTKLHKQGFKNADYDISLASNGSYFHGAHLLPFIGYDSDLELADPKTRQQHGLIKRQRLPELIAGNHYQTHGHEADSSWMNFRARVSTEQGQTPIATGILQNTWVENGRVYSDYSVDHKIINFIGFASAVYKTKRVMAGTTEVSAYFHESHGVNIDHMLSVAAQTLEYYESTFGAYPLPQLNLVEIPNRAFARAYPGTIFFSEHVGYKEDLSAGTGIDHFAKLIAHEIAHMWWGHQLVAAKTEGEVLLIESLAEYSAWMMMKQRYGEDYIDSLTKTSSKHYFHNRSLDTHGETPLFKITGQRYLRYHKGPLVLNGIRHVIGEDNVNHALKQLLQKKANIDQDYATSLDLISALKQNAPPSVHGLLDQWLTEIVTYDLRVNRGEVEQLADGQYQVTAYVTAREQHLQPSGDTVESLLIHSVEVALLTDNETPIAVSEFRLDVRSGEQKITVTVPVKPAFLLLDPKSVFIEKNHVDNRIRL